MRLTNCNAVKKLLRPPRHFPFWRRWVITAIPTEAELLYGRLFLLVAWAYNIILKLPQDVHNRLYLIIPCINYVDTVKGDNNDNPDTQLHSGKATFFNMAAMMTSGFGENFHNPEIFDLSSTNWMNKEVSTGVRIRFNRSWIFSEYIWSYV